MIFFFEIRDLKKYQLTEKYVFCIIYVIQISNMIKPYFKTYTNIILYRLVLNSKIDIITIGMYYKIFIFNVDLPNISAEQKKLCKSIGIEIMISNKT